MTEPLCLPVVSELIIDTTSGKILKTTHREVIECPVNKQLVELFTPMFSGKSVREVVETLTTQNAC